MSKRSLVQLKNLTDTVIKKNENEEITAIKDNALRTDFIDSFLNLTDGGLLIESETGYASPITPGSDYSFATKKYVDDTAGSIDISGKISLDGSSSPTTGNISIGNNLGLTWNTDVYLKAQSAGNMDISSMQQPMRFFSKNSLYQYHNAAGTAYGELDFSAMSGNRNVKFQNKDYTGVADLSDIVGSYIKTAGTSILTANTDVSASGFQFLLTGASILNFQTVNGVFSSLIEMENNIKFTVANSTQTTINEHSPSGSNIFGFDATTKWFQQIDTTGFAFFSGDLASPGIVRFKTDNVTNQRVVQMQNSDGTMAYLSDVTGLSGSFVAKAGDTMTGQLIAPSYVVNGTAGSGYLQLPVQSSRPTAVSGNNIIYTTSGGGMGWIRKNVALSSDIYREMQWPDANTSITFPTPDAGGADVLAYRNSINPFTVQQNFSAAGIYIFDTGLGSYREAMRYGATTSLIVGTGFGTTNIASGQTTIAGNFSTTSSSSIMTFSMYRSVNGTDMKITANSPGGGNNLLLGGNFISGAYVTSVSLPGAATPHTYIRTATNTGAVGVAGNICLTPGTPTGAAGGNVQFFTETLQATSAGILTALWGNANTEPTAVNASGVYQWSFGQKMKMSGSIVLPFVGSGLEFKTGTNARVGSSTLASGTVTVANTSITANSHIIVTATHSGTPFALAVTYNAGVGFTITSANVADTRTVKWVIFEQI